MLKEYFDSHEHKDQPPRQFRLTAEAGAKESAYLDPRSGQKKGGQTDEGDGGQDIHLKKGESDPHRQRVDAGRQRQREHGAEGEGAVYVLALFTGLPHHVDTDDGQKEKGDPVVHCGDEGLELDAEQPAKQRHHGLKASEIETAGEIMDRAKMIC